MKIRVTLPDQVNEDELAAINTDPNIQWQEHIDTNTWMVCVTGIDDVQKLTRLWNSKEMDRIEAHRRADETRINYSFSYLINNLTEPIPWNGNGPLSESAYTIMDWVNSRDEKTREAMETVIGMSTNIAEDILYINRRLKNKE